VHAAFCDLLAQLHAADIRYAILRSPDDEKRDRRELDILVDPQDFERLLKVSRWHGFVRDGMSALRPLKDVLYCYDDQCLLVLDVHRALVSKGVVYLDAEGVLGRRELRDGAFNLSPADELAHLVCHVILDKSVVPLKYLQRVSELLALGSVRRAAERYLSGRGLSKPFSQVAARWQELPWQPQACQRLRRAMLARLFVAQPANLVRYAARWVGLAMRRLEGRRGIVLALLGPDGVGKSTLAERLKSRLGELGLKTGTVYMGPFGQSILPVSKLVRWVGRPGERSRRFSYAWVGEARWLVYLAILAVEFTLRYLLRLIPARRRHDVVLSDRYLYDILVGYKTSTTEQAMSARRRLCRLYPRPRATVILTAEAATVAARKSDLNASAAQAALQAYRRMARHFNVILLENQGEINGIVERLIGTLWPTLFCRRRAHSVPFAKVAAGHEPDRPASSRSVTSAAR